MTSSTVQCMQRDGYSTVLLSSLSVIKQKVHCAADLRRALVPVLVLFKNEIVQSVLLKLSRYSTVGREQLHTTKILAIVTTI